MKKSKEKKTAQNVPYNADSIITNKKGRYNVKIDNNGEIKREQIAQ